MIEKTTAFMVGEKVFPCIEEAQRHEILNLLSCTEEVAGAIMDHSEQIVDILTTTAASKPKARAINGGRKPRKAKSAVATESTTEQPA